MPATFEAALRAAGGAVALVDGLLGGTARTGVLALRPPGHHAEPGRAMGFCYFGNVAVGARRALSSHGLERVLILDWDVHHGNGTGGDLRRRPLRPVPSPSTNGRCIPAPGRRRTAARGRGRGTP